MEEEAKAVQEVAKTTGKAIDASVKVGNFIRKIFGDAFIEIGGSIHDWAKYFRYQNILKIQDKVDAIHKKRQVEGKTIPIPPRYAISLVQSASEEDEETIQALWATLIANATDPEKKVDLRKVYINILSSLEPIDVRILDYLSKQGWNLMPGPHSEGINVRTLSDQLNLSDKEVQLSLQNLARLGCIVDAYQPRFDDIGSTSFGARVADTMTTFRPSPLGFSLIAACKE